MSDATEKTVLDIAAETLTGDIRDALLTHIRSMEDPWSKLSEKAQGEKIYAVTKTADYVVAQAVKLIATNGLPHIHVKTGKFTVKDGVKLEVLAVETVTNITALASHGQAAAVLVLADSSPYDGERAAARPDPDEPGLPLQDDDDRYFDPNPEHEE